MFSCCSNSKLFKSNFWFKKDGWLIGIVDCSNILLVLWWSLLFGGNNENGDSEWFFSLFGTELFDCWFNFKPFFNIKYETKTPNKVKIVLIYRYY